MPDTIKPPGGWSQIYGSIFEQSIMGVVLCDIKGLILECNPAFCRMLGYTGDEILSMTVQKLTHPDDWEREASFFSTFATRPPGTHYAAEKRLLHKNGPIVWVKIHATTIRGADSAPVFGFAIVEDITERKKSEDSLRDSESRYRSLFSEMTSGFALHTIIVDEAGKPSDYRYIDVNPAFEALTGLRRENVIGRTVRELIPNIEPVWISRFGNVALTGVPDNFENHVEVMNKDFSVHAYSTKPGQFAVVFVDITSQVRALKQLADEKERLSVVLRSISDAVVATDVSGAVVSVNKLANQWLSRSQQEITGKLVWQVLALTTAMEHHSCAHAIEDAVRGQQRYEPSAPLRLVTVDGSERWVTISGNPMCDSASNPVGMVFALRDVTERLRMETERIKTEKLESLGHLAAGIAHDFNNLLTAILGNVSLARTHAETPASIEELLADAETALHHAHKLTHQLLTFAEGGSPVKTAVAPGTLVREAAEFVLHGSNSQLVLNLPDSLWQIEADAHQIAQAIQSLVINADQAMPGGGPIHIVAENILLETGDLIPLAHGPYVKIAITDSGVGIAERFQDKIFDPYFTTKQQGSGMGLATTLSIVKNHGGHITVESRLGIGSTFEIYLPAINHHETAPFRITVPASPIHRKTLALVMDDEEAIRNLVNRILTHNGCAVTAVATGEEALAAYEAARSSGRPFDVVILDLTIRGGMGGKDTIQRLREMDPSVKAIVSSGYSNDPVMANYRKYGFRGIVPKPYQSDALIKAVAELVQAKPGP